MRRGTSASSVSGSISKWTVRRSWKRVCSISRFFSEELQLLLQRNPVHPRLIERQSQEIAETADHPVRDLRLRVHQGGDGVERVEQKVRVKLRLQRPQPSVGQLRLQLQGVHRARLRLSVIRERVTQADDGGVRHQRPVHVGQELALRHGEPVCSSASWSMSGHRGVRRTPNRR